MSEETRFIPHSDKQDQAIFSDADLTLVATGTQWGKSQAAAIWMKRQILLFDDPEDNFVLMAPSYKVMNQSMLPYFLRVMEGYGRHNKTDGEFKLHWGSTVYLRTGTDPNSIVGIPKVRAFWLDEAGLASLYFWENVQARAAAMGARGLLTTSPYAQNWLYKDFIKPKEKGLLPQLPLIQAASWENPYHGLSDPKKRQAMQETMDPRRFNALFGGKWTRMAGLVYDCWDDDENLIQPGTLPTGTVYVAGIDWGFTDPFVMKVRAITPDGRHIGVSEFYKSGMTQPEMVAIAQAKMQTYSIQRFWADPSNPGAIEEFNRNGLPTIGADNDIRRGLDLHYELIKTRKYKEFRGACPHSMDERETYHYPEPLDLKPEQDSKEQLPVGQEDHCMDVDRYLTISTYRSDRKHTPKVPEARKPLVTVEDRLAHIRKIKRVGGAESWS